jgi:hypothetical protein
MTVQQIKRAVRLCIDEEAVNTANLNLATVYDFGTGDIALMDNIITAKILDALRWLCLNAPAELLADSDTPGHDTGIIFEGTQQPVDSIPNESATATGNRIVLPSGFIRLLRVRGASWHRAVSGDSLLREDSEEYLQLNDPSCAYATPDRPQAVLIDKKSKELECWPSDTEFEYTCVVCPSTVGSESVPLPPLATSAVIYYLAFLVLSAYGDERAARMLDIAKQSIGKQ